MSKIIFVNPPLSLQERYGVRFQSGGQTPPQGLLILAALTRKHNYETKIIDAEVLGWGPQRVAEEVLKLDPQFVGITSATVAIYNAAEVAKLIKEKRKNITILLGGAHFTAIPQKTMLMFPQFDFGCWGESEETLLEFLETANKGGDFTKIKGLVTCQDDRLYFSEKRPRIKDLDNLPTPAWDLLPNLAKFYCPPVHTVKKFPAACLVTSRGCFGRCTFCDRSMFGNTYTFHSAEYVMEMVEHLYYQYGIREIQFKDDDFPIFKGRLFKICEELKKRKLDLSWSCTSRVDQVTPELLSAMKESGCWQVWYGIESGSQRILDIIGKGITLEQIHSAIYWTKEAGINPCGFFMLGNPTETKESLQETINLATKLPIADCLFTFMTPSPGSELYHEIHKYGTFEEDWSKMNNMLPLFIPHDLSRRELVSYSKKAYRRFYFKPIIFFYYLKRIRSLRILKIYLSGFLALLEYLLKKRWINRKD